MIECPNCGWSYSVIEKSSYLDEQKELLYRTYVCYECNHTFDTQQKVVKVFKPKEKEQYINKRGEKV